MLTNGHRKPEHISHNMLNQLEHCGRGSPEVWGWWVYRWGRVSTNQNENRFYLASSLIVNRI